jgi:hypothetical protein
MNDYKYNYIHPKLEIARYKIITKIFNTFYNILQKYNSNISRNKSDTMITLFCWKNITNIDPVIPYNSKYNYDQLIIDLSTFNFNPKKILKKFNIEKLLSKYIKKFDDYYKNINKNKKIIITQTDTSLIYKDKYIVEFSKETIDKLNKHLQIQYFSKDYNIDKNVLFFCILFRYKLMSAGNQQLSVLTSFKEDLKNKFLVKTELFGSCINRYFDNYCSLFYDLEKYFGSLGNFFNQTLTEGLYFANPPFDEDIMERMAKKILLSLDNTNKPLGFIITVPVWDKYTQELLAKKCNNQYNNITDSVKYNCKDIIEKSKYLYKKYIFCKKDFPYYSFTEKRIIYASNTYIFIVKNNLLHFNINLFESILYNNNLKNSILL